MEKGWILLTEATKAQLLNKSKNADNYKDTSKGKNRYERRLKSRVANSVRQFNKIDMDALWKRGILTVGIEVHGETNDYVVQVRFNDVLDKLQNEVKHNNNKLEFKSMYRAISDAFATSDVQTHCNCPDSKFRMNYWLHKNGDGILYEPRPSNITNPHDTKGAGCKHTLLVLSNRDWIMKVASVVLNYIKYCQKNLEKSYATYIFPKVYGMPYDKALQYNMFDQGVFTSNQDTLKDIASTNLRGRDEKGKFTQGNDFRFQKKSPQLTPDEEDDGQIKMGISRLKNGKDVLTYQKNDDRDNIGRFVQGNQVARKTSPFSSKQIVPSEEEK